jgi:hypothetical protein
VRHEESDRELMYEYTDPAVTKVFAVNSVSSPAEDRNCSHCRSSGGITDSVIRQFYISFRNTGPPRLDSLECHILLRRHHVSTDPRLLEVDNSCDPLILANVRRSTFPVLRSSGWVWALECRIALVFPFS